MIGDYNNKPLYKQDEGENYLYYQNKTWLVGPHLGVTHAAAHGGTHSSCIKDYAWMKLDSDGASRSEESSSSDSSDSETEEGEEKFKEKKYKKTKSMGLFKEGWKYKQQLMGTELQGGEDAVHWMGDDTTLKVEALKGK